MNTTTNTRPITYPEAVLEAKRILEFHKYSPTEIAHVIATMLVELKQPVRES